MVKKIILGWIRTYQKTLSLDHGWFSRFYPQGFCKFTPSCSQYTYLAVEKYGTARGLAKGLFRVVRCNPWSKGGKDLP